MTNSDFDSELENIHIERDIKDIQKNDDEYLRTHPDPYANVDFRVAQIQCPFCKKIIPYQGCAYHFYEHVDNGDITRESADIMVDNSEKYLIHREDSNE